MYLNPLSLIVYNVLVTCLNYFGRISLTYSIFFIIDLSIIILSVIPWIYFLTLVYCN